MYAEIHPNSLKADLSHEIELLKYIADLDLNEHST